MFMFMFTVGLVIPEEVSSLRGQKIRLEAMLKSP